MAGENIFPAASVNSAPEEEIGGGGRDYKNKFCPRLLRLRHDKHEYTRRQMLRKFDLIQKI